MNEKNTVVYESRCDYLIPGDSLALQTHGPCILQ